MIIVPRTPVLPVATMQRLKALADQGATIVFEDRAPSDVPGFGEQAARRAQLAAAASTLNAPAHPLEWFKTSVPGEPMYASGLRCVRRARPDGYDYFVVNRSEKAVDRVPLGVQASAALVMDPRFENRIGAASIISSPVMRGAATAPRTELALHVEPGESFVIRTYTRALAGTVPAWNNWAPAGAAIPLAGAWAVSFIEGGPVAPRPLSVKADAAGKLSSWTDASDDPEARRFAGTAKYTLRFSKPAGNAADYRLALGKVGDSARVALNGKPLGTLWAEPYTITLGDALKAGENTLEIEVTNVAANRIRDMDQRGVQWKIFRDANVLSTGYTAFDASGWPVRPAGLMGPVTLTPVQAAK
jgi:hypothetical protein